MTTVRRTRKAISSATIYLKVCQAADSQAPSHSRIEAAYDHACLAVVAITPHAHYDS